MKIPLLQWLLQGIPESLAIVYLAIALAGQKPETWKILLLGIIDAVIIYLIRLLPLTFGVHSILQILVIAFLLHLFFKVSFGKSLFSALTVIITLAVTETVFCPLCRLLASHSKSFPKIFCCILSVAGRKLFCCSSSPWP